MTRKQYKVLCRKKVNRWTQNIMLMLLILTFFICEYFQVNGYMTASISVIVWIKSPSKIIYLLEEFYKLRHDEVSYK